LHARDRRAIALDEIRDDVLARQSGSGVTPGGSSPGLAALR
jgi:hypothetical protein